MEHTQLLKRYRTEHADSINGNFDTWSKQFDYHIEFDGGTSCNIPAKGYGEGYGSYSIYYGSPDYKMIKSASRVKFGEGHSCNSAELITLLEALKSLGNCIRDLTQKGDKSQSYGYIPDKVIIYPSVLICGDSMIALKWIHEKKHPKKTSSEKFCDAINQLRTLKTQLEESAIIGEITTYWRGRKKSVELFGH